MFEWSISDKSLNSPVKNDSTKKLGRISGAVLIH